MVVLKTERYGMFWAGKIKFALSNYSFDAGRSEVKLIEYQQNDIAITIYNENGARSQVGRLSKYLEVT